MFVVNTRAIRKALTWSSRANAVSSGKTGAYLKRATLYTLLGKLIGGGGRGR